MAVFPHLLISPHGLFKYVFKKLENCFLCSLKMSYMFKWPTRNPVYASIIEVYASILLLLLLCLNKGNYFWLILP